MILCLVLKQYIGKLCCILGKIDNQTNFQALKL